MTQPVDDRGSLSIVIFLNGASSAGKTSIATVLQHLLDQPSLHVTFDSFIEMLPAYELFAPARFHDAFARTVSGFHRSLPALATTGLPLIVDHVLQEPEWLQECVVALSQVSVWFVGVRCPLAELERREQARADRMPGMARHHFPRVHQHELYDVEVDTSQLTPEACARRVHEALHGRLEPRAFEQLRALARERSQPIT
jgi:chloramphenicol 3-O phosphotransferase